MPKIEGFISKGASKGWSGDVPVVIGVERVKNGIDCIPCTVVVGESLEGDKQNGWWCQSCKKYVEGVEVKYDETHDERCGGCGYRVIPERRETCEGELARYLGRASYIIKSLGGNNDEYEDALARYEEERK